MDGVDRQVVAQHRAERAQAHQVAELVVVGHVDAARRVAALRVPRRTPGAAPRARRATAHAVAEVLGVDRVTPAGVQPPAPAVLARPLEVGDDPLRARPAVEAPDAGLTQRHDLVPRDVLAPHQPPSSAVRESRLARPGLGDVAPRARQLVDERPRQRRGPRALAPEPEHPLEEPHALLRGRPEVAVEPKRRNAQARALGEPVRSGAGPCGRAARWASAPDGARGP